MRELFHYILDFIFPPSREELALRALSPREFSLKSPRAPQAEFPFISSCLSYKDPLVRELVWQIKYKKNQHALELAGYALYTELQKIPSSIVLIPIPISKKRRKERGYNQCELLIEEILKLDTEKRISKDFLILTRPKHQERQTDKNREERIHNAQHIFSAVKQDGTQKTLVIIDDVTTTGSTLREAREVLLQAGYTDVRGLTIAH
ncbi:MAG: hypothetical protein V4697_00615 [Patescibacteria group bacterium]